MNSLTLINSLLFSAKSNEGSLYCLQISISPSYSDSVDLTISEVVLILR